MIALNDFPKGKKLLQEFAKRNLLAFQKNVMKEQPVEGLEIPEITEEMAESYANALITTNLRILYDFWDEQGLKISIVENDNKFIGEVSRTSLHTKEYDNRLECEQEIFEQCFKKEEE